MRRARALGVALVLAGACGGREESAAVPVEEVTPAKTEGTPGTGTGTGTEPAEAAGCRDWSTLDLGRLPQLPDGEWVAMLDEVWRRVRDKHFDPTLGCVDWPALRKEYADKVAKARDRTEAFALVNEMLGRLEQSHFHLFQPGGGEGDDEPVGPAMPPMQVRWIEDALVVVRSTARGHLGTVPAGATLLAIDDVPVERLTERARDRSLRPTELAFTIARAATARLSCERAGHVKKLELTDPKRGNRKVIRMVECEEPPGERVTLGHLRDIPTRVEHRMLRDGVGYLAFNIWMLPMVKRVEEAMAALRKDGMTALVLDLRGNPGGVGAMSVPVARMLLTDGGSLGKLQFRDFAQEFNVEANPDAFTGKVAILVDEGTASTSEIFAAGLHDLGRATVFGGGPSAGAALPSVIEEIPGGGVLQYVVGDYRSPRGTVVEGVGVLPDIKVPEMREDFAAGRDRVLEAAVHHVRGDDQEEP